MIREKKLPSDKDEIESLKLALIELIASELSTEEFDLVILNEGPSRNTSKDRFS
jgi:hypothetical protein